MEVQKIGFARRAIKADGMGAGIVPIDPQSLKSFAYFFTRKSNYLFLYVKMTSCHDAIPIISRVYW
jgi:hypothetical protein